MQNITALGPKNPFSANLLSALGVTHFTNEEMKDTFDEFTGGSGFVEKSQVYALLRKTYGFEPMPEEMGLFVTALDLGEEGGKLTWEELEAGCDQIRETLGGVSKHAAEYSSADLYRIDHLKHLRLTKDPMDKYKTPMTESQVIGWHEEEVTNERFPQKSCAETRFAGAMVKSGVDPF